MPYDIVDSASTGYVIVSGTPFVDFDAGRTFLDIMRSFFPGILFTSSPLSDRTGNGSRKECLFKMSFDIAPTSFFYVYCLQTEGGGRWNLITNGEDEARIQWRNHSQWTPDLNTLRPALNFQSELQNTPIDLTNKECYIFSFYKRDSADSDIVISALYPTQAQGVEDSSTSNKSIQLRYSDIRDAFLRGVSATSKGNSELIIHFKPQYLIWYMINRDALHMSSLEKFETMAASLTQPPTNPQPSNNRAESISPNIPRNKIIYGAPGTGKSFELREQAKAIGFTDNNTIRITFHPNYSYQQFVGAYKPTPIYKSSAESDSYFGSDRITRLNEPANKEPIIDYSFVPGPLLNLLVKALLDPSNNYLLIIEEINRAPVSSVFGDVFQLLDRDDDGQSEYHIEFNVDASNHLSSLGITERKVKFPKNLFIWATMNSADQGVMPMDAAFKRRWAFEYLPLNSKNNIVESRTIIFQGKEIKWNHFRARINDKLIELGIAEDKLVGPFFLNKVELKSDSSIKNKLLLYLRDDVVRHNAESLFKKKTFSEIILDYRDGNEIFQGIIFEVVTGTPVAIDDANGE